jgi:hypothetical integral membrane protein (TIGR02206 family)
MRSAVAEYLKTYESFELFGPSHWTAIFLFIFLLIWLPWYGKKHLESKEQDMLCKVLSILIFINYPVWVLLESIGGTFNVKLHLPFHLCRFANLMIPFVLIRRNEFMFQILYFWGLSGMLQGIISPDIIQDFPHFHYFRFFIGHHLLVVAIIYMVVIYDMKPTLLGLKNAFIGMNLFLLLSFIVNILLDANYFWIMEKPPAGSLLDFMGPWPWYIITGEFVALAHFGLFFLIYKFIKPQLNHA